MFDENGDARRELIRAAMSTSLSGVAASFDPDELAYLAVTSKVELPLRDRLAWLLHQELSPELIVAREWRRADLAVLRGPEALAQVEAKAMYSFDVLSDVGRQAYVQKLLSDAAKMHALAPGSDTYLLALVTDVAGDIPVVLRKHVIKYSAGIRKAALSAGDAGPVSSARTKWLAELATFTADVQHESLAGGSVWGLDVTVDAFLVGPLPALLSGDPEKAAAADGRLIAYNDDDVRATRAVREGIADDGDRR
jgi:hypothetical protein